MSRERPLAGSFARSPARPLAVPFGSIIAQRSEKELTTGPDRIVVVGGGGGEVRFQAWRTCAGLAVN